ncbi:MAG: HAMP domain-containing histidine kinase [Gemmatimonadales bacterium]|nr:HAMP domain-containing histidine kinase [Gemmatimonadales bacterium]
MSGQWFGQPAPVNSCLGHVRVLPRTLSSRIAFLAGFLALGGVATLSFILISSQRKQVLAEVIHSSESIAETIRLSINHDMLANRREGVHEVIVSVGEHPGIARVRLFNKEGRISYSSWEEEVGRVVDKQAEACITCHAESEPYRNLDLEDRSRIYTDPQRGRTLATIYVIRNEEGCHPAGCHALPATQSVLGVLDVAMSLEPTQDRLFASTRNALLVSLAAVVLITSALFFLIRQSVRQPVTRLIAATRRVAEGDYTLQVPSGATDEIGFLAQSFNEMIESLDTSQQHLEEKFAQKAEELRTAQFQVVQAEKLSSVGLVAAGIAHELNSPLMAIVTFAHMVQKRVPPDSQEHEDLRMILHETDRCAAIIRTLLDFSRDQSQEPHIELLEVAKLIEQALEILRVEVRSHGVEIDMSVPGNLPFVEANAVQLTQVFVNLILNAIQAMPDGGRITLKADATTRTAYPSVKLPPSPRRQLLRIRVRDSGTGIPSKDLDKIFDPFFTTKPVGQGSGLGLSVSHAIITRHRGTILVTSDGKSWAEFTVLIPVAEQPVRSPTS